MSLIHSIVRTIALERLHTGAHPDEAVLTALYEGHRGELFAFLIRMTHDRDAAEDLLQETFVRHIWEARAGRMPDEWLSRDGVTWIDLGPSAFGRAVIANGLAGLIGVGVPDRENVVAVWRLDRLASLP